MKKIARTTLPEYRVWSNMKQRCTNPNNPGFKDYGERGIAVCQEWMDSFDVFFADMGECPKDCTIDRTDNEGNYEPSNCKWTTWREQQTNRRNNTAFDGVCWIKADSKWRAVSSLAGKGNVNGYIGQYKCHLTACYARHAHDMKETNNMFDNKRIPELHHNERPYTNKDLLELKALAKAAGCTINLPTMSKGSAVMEALGTPSMKW